MNICSKHLLAACSNASVKLKLNAFHFPHQEGRGKGHAFNCKKKKSAFIDKYEVKGCYLLIFAHPGSPTSPRIPFISPQGTWGFNFNVMKGFLVEKESFSLLTAQHILRPVN